MSKELQRELRKIERAIKSNVFKVTEIIYSELSFKHIYKVIDNTSFINDNGDFVLEYRLRHSIGAKIRNTDYSIYNPSEILKALLELDYERKTKKVIRFHSSIGYYQNGLQIDPSDLSIILKTATIITPKSFNKLFEYMKTIGIERV